MTDRIDADQLVDRLKEKENLWGLKYEDLLPLVREYERQKERIAELHKELTEAQAELTQAYRRD